jgi:hypothetical protein
MQVWGMLPVVLATDWGAVGAIAGIVGVIVAVVVPIMLARRSKKAGDRPDDPPAPVANAGLSEKQIENLSQCLTHYTSVIYKMDLEQKSPEGRKKNFTPQYMQWAHQEDQLRSEILLTLNPAKPEQERLIQTLESFGREADPNEPWIRRRDRLLAVAQQVYAAERANPK